MDRGEIVTYYGRPNGESTLVPYEYPNNPNKNNTPFEIPGCPVFGIFAATVVGVLWLLFSLTLPAYHYTRIVFPIDNYMDLNFGLWTLYASSNCDSIINFNINREICRRVVSHMDNLSLADATNFVCSLEAGILSLLNLGCNEFHLIRQGSAILIIMFTMSVILLFFASIFLLTFWFCYRTKRVRQSIFMLHFTAALICTLGMVGYLLVGGLTIQPFRDSSMFGLGSGFIARLLFVDISRSFDLSTGFAFAAFGMIWVILLPLWSICALPPTMCVDISEADDELAREQGNFAKLLEQASNYPYYNQQTFPQSSYNPNIYGPNRGYQMQPGITYYYQPQCRQLYPQYPMQYRGY
ncbi:hypothetical protein cand_033910 [Cryptosporidium andersoni]|uniref:Uncharacterized protein n=1 Tax=Cryptosporidium andersoni TaxID=117008 RepID=A0A1J4MZE0_9CRYT|nr:hypothetical protein cand_033910 [Cryptosporidium andersoni]